MRTVSLGFLVIENFKSFVGTNEIEISTTVGLKYIGGTNKVTPRLGSNGAGKTSLWDALIWCWTGYSIRGHRAADLVTWGSKTQPHVITGITIDGVEHTIERWGSPNRLLINDVLSEQTELDAFLLPRNCLLQAVVFGQSSKLFLDMSEPERGELLDSVLNLAVWSDLSDEARDKAKGALTEFNELEKQIEHSKGQMVAYETQYNDAQNNETMWQHTHNAAYDLLSQQIADAEATHLMEKRKLANLMAQRRQAPDQSLVVEAMRTAEERLQGLHQTIGMQQHGMEQLGHEHQFFDQHTVCPTCKQRITEAFRLDKIAVLAANLRELEAGQVRLADDEQREVAKVTEARQVYDDYARKVNTLDKEIALTQQACSNLGFNIERMRLQAKGKAAEGNPYSLQMQQFQAAYGAIADSMDAMEEAAGIASQWYAHYTYWQQGFKRVRLYEVNQVLDRLNLETANAASALGIGDWTITNSVSMETKSGTVKPGIFVTVTEPSGQRIVEDSAGENQRVRLASAFGFSSLIQNMAGIYFDFAVFDEPCSWLSTEGVYDLLDQLKSIAEISNRSIWVLDHRVLDYSGFTERWRVTKDQTGSHLALE
jgi:DNA repair exonuclease SbcCD ATPase subunit